MQVLTPSGYRDASSLASGDDASAFDAETGAPIVNHVEAVQPVDYAEWCRWWQVEETVPAFNWYRINGTFLLFGEQSVWRNGTNVCHAKDLIVGDEVYDDADQPVIISSVEPVEDQSLIWYRFDISGDHSYIIDGLTVHNASRFWVGGTGTWDSSTTTHWAASTGAAGGQSVPGSADAVTLDANSGGGTATLNFGGSITLQTITCGGFTGGTLDNSVNNNNVTLSGSGNAFIGTGSSARTIKLGTATYTLSSNTGRFTFTTTTNLTYIGSSANIVFTGTGQRIFDGGGLSHGNVTFAAISGNGYAQINGSNTFASLVITAPNYVTFALGTTNTITAAFTWAGSSIAQIGIASASLGTAVSIAAAAGSIGSYCALKDITFTGSPVISNSFDLGNNSGATITAPGGGGSFGVIGS